MSISDYDTCVAPPSRGGSRYKPNVIAAAHALGIETEGRRKVDLCGAIAAQARLTAPDDASCAFPPSRGGMRYRPDLLKAAMALGIDTTGLKKRELCQRVAAQAQRVAKRTAVAAEAQTIKTVQPAAQRPVQRQAQRPVQQQAQQPVQRPVPSASVPIAAAAAAVTPKTVQPQSPHEQVMKRLGFQCAPEAEPAMYMFDDNPTCLQDLECLKKHLRFPKIADGTDKVLSYRSFQELRRQGKLSNDMAEALLDEATKGDDMERSAILFRKPEKLVPEKDYSINLFWIHKDKLPSASGHLFGTDDNKLREYVLKPLCDWRQKQPNATINFWYDSATQGGPQQMKETQRILNDDLHLNVNLRDVRTIPFVRDHPEMMAVSLPVYYRVDLAKALILDNVIVHDKKLYAVVSDADVVAYVKDQLFDKYTVDYLDEFGYMFGSCLQHGGAEQENSFMIMKNDRRSGPIQTKMYKEPRAMNTVDRHRKWIIDEARQKFGTLTGDIKLDQEKVFGLYLNFKGVLKHIRNTLHPQNMRKTDGKVMGLPSSRFSLSASLCPISDLNRVRKHVARAADVQ